MKMEKNDIRRHILGAASLAVSVASGAVNTFLVSEGGWDAPANWDNAVPTLADTAVIGGGRSVVSTGNAEAASVSLADAGGDGTLTLAGGGLTVSNAFSVGAAAGTTGVLNQTDGWLTVSNAAGAAVFRVGAVVRANGVHTFSGGTNSANGVSVAGFTGSTGIVHVTGGWLATAAPDGKAGGSAGNGAGSYAEINVSAGAFNIQHNFSFGNKSNGGFGRLNVSGGNYKSNNSNLYNGHIRVSGGSVTFNDLALDRGEVEIVGSGATLINANNGWHYSSNVTTRVKLDEGGLTPLASGNGNKTTTLGGALQVGRVSPDTAVPASILLVKVAGTLAGAFDSVVWEDGLRGEISTNISPKEVWLVNVTDEPPPPPPPIYPKGTVFYIK
jgi:hypothetical protein